MRNWQEDTEATNDEMKSVAGCGIFAIIVLVIILVVALWLLLKFT